MNVFDSDKAKAEIRKQLPVVAKEVLDWENTGVLCDGQSRKIAKLYLNDNLNYFKILLFKRALEYITT